MHTNQTSYASNWDQCVKYKHLSSIGHFYHNWKQYCLWFTDHWQTINLVLIYSITMNIDIQAWFIYINWIVVILMMWKPGKYFWQHGQVWIVVNPWPSSEWLQILCTEWQRLSIGWVIRVINTWMFAIFGEWIEEG